MTHRATVVAMLGLALASVAAPARAHPFGPPPTAHVAARGDRVVVDWSATPDDAVAIGELLGVMPEGSAAAYRQEAAAQVAPSAADEAALSASPALRDYLGRHITAEQDGTLCSPEIPPIDDFVHDGVRVLLRCPRDVSAVVLRITMLHDVHPAYRTLAVGDGTDPAESVFTVSAPEHRWRFDGEATGGNGYGATLVAVAAVSILAGGALVVRRRLRARRSSA